MSNQGFIHKNNHHEPPTPHELQEVPLSLSLPRQKPTSMTCTMPQHLRSTVALVPPYTNTQSPMMGDTSQPNSACSSPQAIPLSPCPSQGERRPSRAQKGKRVHLCEYSGCGKVFTRAEHRRRHELIHKSKKLHSCPREGCTKSFHRAAYLAQHIARHGPEPHKKSSVRSSQLSLAPVSSVQTSHFTPGRSPAFQAFQSPLDSTYMTVPNGIEQPIMPPPQDLGIQHLSQQDMRGSCLINDRGGVGHNPVTAVARGMSAEPVTSNASTTGLDMVIDPYLRSVLRTEAFLTPPQPQEILDASLWDGRNHPNLPQTSPATCVPWSGVANTVLSEEQTPERPADPLSSPPDWQ